MNHIAWSVVNFSDQEEYLCKSGCLLCSQGLSNTATLSSLRNLHIEIGSGDEEGLGDAVRRGQVRSKLGNGLHAVIVSLEIRVARVDSLVVAKGADGLFHLEKHEIHHRKSASEVVLVAEELSELGVSLNSLVNDFTLWFALEAHHQEAKHEVLDNALELDDPASLRRV